MAIAATTAGLKTLADDTVRITIDIDPKYAPEAFQLFGARGIPVAVARMTDDAALLHAQNEAKEEKKGGDLARMAAMFCDDSKFRAWLAWETDSDALRPGDADDLIKQICGVDSKRELDHNPQSSEVFHEKIRKPFIEWRDS